MFLLDHFYRKKFLVGRKRDAQANVFLKVQDSYSLNKRGFSVHMSGIFVEIGRRSTWNFHC